MKSGWLAALALLLGCGSQLSFVLQAEASSQAPEDVWLREELASQIRASTGVIRCGEVMAETPQAIRLTKNQAFNFESLTPVGDIENMRVKIRASEGRPRYWSLAFGGDQLAITYYEGLQPRTVTYVKSDSFEADAALVQDAQCLEAVVARAKNKIKPQGDLELENSAVFAKHQMRILMADATPANAGDGWKLAGYTAGVYLAGKDTRLLRESLEMARNVRYANEMKAINLASVPLPNLEAVRAAESVVALDNALVRRLERGGSVAWLTTLVFLGFAAHQAWHYVMSETPAQYIAKKPELAALMNMTDAEFRGLVAADPRKGRLMIRAIEKFRK